MEANGIEKEVLEEIAKRLLMSKEELLKIFENKVDLSALEEILKSLIEKGYIANISPLGSSYVVTVKGIKASRNEGKEFKEGFA